MSGESDTTRFYAICRKSVAFNPTGAAPASTGFTAALQISSTKVKFAIIRARSHGRVETGSLEVDGRLLRVSSSSSNIISYLGILILTSLLYLHSVPSPLSNKHEYPDKLEMTLHPLTDGRQHYFTRHIGITRATAPSTLQAVM